MGGKNVSVDSDRTSSSSNNAFPMTTSPIYNAQAAHALSSPLMLLISMLVNVEVMIDLLTFGTADFLWEGESVDAGAALELRLLLILSTWRFKLLALY